MAHRDYYTDFIDELPFSTVVDLYSQHLPRFFATAFVGWHRVRAKLGFPLMPLYGSLWQPDIEWQSRREMPPPGLSRTGPWLEQLEDLDFEIVGWRKSDTVGNKQELNCFLLNESGETVAQLLWLRIGTIEKTTLTLISYRQDGSEIMTAGLPAEQLPLIAHLVPDYVEYIHRPAETSPSDLYRVHAERPELPSAIPFTHETLLPFYRRQRTRFFQTCLKRKLLRPLKAREFQYLDSTFGRN